MVLSDHVTTFGQYMLKKHGARVHKVAINAEFTCPNRDGTKGIGGCTFCNNVSFSPNARKPASIANQIEAGRQVIAKRTGARLFMAYFQAYTNTYADPLTLNQLYREALHEPDVIGLAVGTRPDCVPDAVLNLLSGYQQEGHEVWLELGLQSAFDDSLRKVNRGHGFDEYRDAIKRAHQHNLKVCTHLIVGLPGETKSHCLESLERVLALGVEGLKLHPLHVVKGTQLANQWRHGQYKPWSQQDYVETVVDMVRHTPSDVIFHRLTGTASADMLLAPLWCKKKWAVLNAIEKMLRNQNYKQARRPQDALEKIQPVTDPQRTITAGETLWS